MAPQDAIGEEVLEVRKPSLTRRMSMEKRVVRRGSSHILIDVLSDSVEVEEIHDMTSSNDFSATSPRFSASSSSIAPSSSVKDHNSLLAEPNRPAHLDKHRITIAAVSPRLRRRPLNDKAAARKSSMPDGGKQSSSEPSAEPPASSYYEPQLRCGVYSMQGRRKAMEDAHTIDLGSGSGSYAPRSASSSDGSSGGGNDVKESKPDHGHPSRAGVADELSNALNMPSSPDGLCAFFGVYDGEHLLPCIIYLLFIYFSFIPSRSTQSTVAHSRACRTRWQARVGLCLDDPASSHPDQRPLPHRPQAGHPRGLPADGAGVP